MKIGSENQTYSNATFDFTANNQVNPTVVDTSLKVQRTIIEIFNQTVQGISDFGAVKPRVTVLNGRMTGTNRQTAMRNLAKQIYTTGTKRFYLDSDTFFFCYGADLKYSLTSRQALIIPYRFALISPVPFIYKPNSGDSGNPFDKTWTIGDANEHTIDNSNPTTWGQPSGDTFQNQGNAPSHIWKWTITNGSGGADITQIEIGDSSTLSGSDNKITISGITLSATKVCNIYLFKIVDNYLKKVYWTVDGTNTGSRNLDGTDAPQIAGDDSTPQFSIKLTGNTANTTVKAEWFDSYWA